MIATVSPDPFRDEHRVIVPSPQDVATYDLKPEMSAYGVRDAVLARLADDECEPLIVVNFANGDMVGHTGVMDAAIKACEVVDECVGEVAKATQPKPKSKRKFCAQAGLLGRLCARVPRGEKSKARQSDD